MATEQSIIDRFLKFVSPEPNSGCWLWAGTGTPQGYGHFARYNGHHEGAHRVAYELFNSSIPEGFDVDHICRVRCCVNPDHLEAVSHRENTKRAHVWMTANTPWVYFGKYPKTRKRPTLKTHCRRGHEFTEENTGLQKASQVRYCRTCHAQGCAAYYKNHPRAHAN